MCADRVHWYVIMRHDADSKHMTNDLLSSSFQVLRVSIFSAFLFTYKFNQPAPIWV